MKSKITSMAVVLACLVGHVPELFSQQPFVIPMAPANPQVFAAVTPSNVPLPPASLAASGVGTAVQVSMEPAAPAPQQGRPAVAYLNDGAIPTSLAQPSVLATEVGDSTVGSGVVASVPATITVAPTPGNLAMSSLEGTAWAGACDDAGCSTVGCGACGSSTACDWCNDCGQPSCGCGCGLLSRFSCFDGLRGFNLSESLAAHGCLDRMGGWHDGMGNGYLRGHLQEWWARHGSFHDGPLYTRPTFMWADFEYLLWWNKGRSIPILATTSAPGTAFEDAGVLGEPGTSVLYGGDGFGGGSDSGVRGTIGFWLDRTQTWGIGVRAFQMGPEEVGPTLTSDGSTILARPFFNADTGVEDSLVVAYPGVSRGSVSAESSTKLTGGDAYLRHLSYFGSCNRLDFICGYQTTEIDDRLRVSHRLTSLELNENLPLGTVIATDDLFRATSEFHGGTIGVMTQGYDGRFTWDLLAKVGFGNSRNRVAIQGQTVSTVPGFGSFTSDQGLLALGTNNGIYESDDFTIVPEVALSLAFSVTNNLQLSVGYTAIYWSNMVSAQDAASTVINPTQISGPLIGPAVPAYSLVDGSFWAQGLSFGVHGSF